MDVAKMAGVSRSTVSFVLNDVPGISISEATRQRVRKAAQALNYFPNSAARKLVSGKSNTLGLILSQSREQVFVDAFLPQVILGVEQAAMAQGFNVLVKPVSPEDTAGYTRLIKESHVDGILLSGPRQSDHEIIRLHQEGVPVMLMGQLPETDIPFVDVNAAMGAETAVNHLIERGYQRIALITNAPLSYTSAQQRRSGYIAALDQACLPVEPAIIREGSFTPASGFRAMQALLKKRPRPDAVFVASDVVAVGALLAIKQAGLRIPQDLAVVGFDDIPLAEYLDPPLTTIRLPAFGLGWAAGERLIRLIRGEGLDEHDVFVESKLIIRVSSGPSAVSS